MNKNRKSFTEQLFDTFVNEKTLSSKNVIILIALIGIIAIIGISFSFTKKEVGYLNEYNNFPIEYNIKILEEVGYSKAELEEMDEDRIYDLADDIIFKTRNQIAGDEWKKELSYSESSEIKTRFYQYAVAGDYESILRDYEELKLNNYLSEPYNKSLIRIYNDAYVINSALSDKNNLVQQKDTLTKINDERMLLCLFLQSSLEARNDTLKDRISLTLSNEDDNLRINSVTSSTMVYSAEKGLHEKDPYLARMIDYINEGDYIVYKVNFSLGLDNFNAYMYKDLHSFKLDIYGIYADDKTALNSKYPTVAESEEALSNMYNYNNSISDFFNNLENSNSNENTNTTENVEIIDDMDNIDEITEDEIVD